MTSFENFNALFMKTSHRCTPASSKKGRAGSGGMTFNERRNIFRSESPIGASLVRVASIVFGSISSLHPLRSQHDVVRSSSHGEGASKAAERAATRAPVTCLAPVRFFFIYVRGALRFRTIGSPRDISTVLLVRVRVLSIIIRSIWN